MTRERLLRSGGVCAFLLALFVLWIADLTKQLICYGDSGTSCRMGLMNAQLVLLGFSQPALSSGRSGSNGGGSPSRWWWWVLLCTESGVS
jgi:hypothetical protein